MSKTDNSLPFLALITENCRIHFPLPPPRINHPEQNGFAIEEREPETLAISRPKLLARPRPPERSSECTEHHDTHRIIQPDDRIGAAPDHIADLRVIPVRDPS